MTAGSKEFSEQTLEAIQKAFEESPTDSGMVTGLLGLVTYINEEGHQRWALLAGPGQTLTQSLGMAKVIDRMIEMQLDDVFVSDES